LRWRVIRSRSWFALDIPQAQVFEFVLKTKAKLGAKAIGRRKLENNQGYELKEPQSSYNRVFDPEKCSLRLKNDHI
jgi:hypothetical protein